MKINTCFHWLILGFVWFFLNAQACTKPIVYGKNHDTDPKKASFQNGKSDVLEAVRQTLKQQGYEIVHVDEYQGKVLSGWKPVQAASHYFDMFGRRDYGASDGAYYQLVVDLIEEGSRVKVLVSTTVKTIVGKLHSNGKIERQILTQLGDYLRSPQIEMTNVGVERK